MKLRTDLKDLRLSELSPAEAVLHHIQWVRTNAHHLPRPDHVQEHMEKLEHEFVTLCRDLWPLTNGERAVIQRSLRMYAANYMEMKGAEKDPAHKRDLQNYIDAADRLAEKLFGAARPTMVHPRKEQP